MEPLPRELPPAGTPSKGQQFAPRVQQHLELVREMRAQPVQATRAAPGDGGPTQAQHRARQRRTWIHRARDWCGDTCAKVPAKEVVYVNLRYCQFMRRTRIKALVLSLAFALIFLVLATSLPGVVEAAWSTRMRASSVLRVHEETAAPKRIGVEVATLADDSGEDVTIHVASVTNAARALMYGARPIMTEVGPFAFRAYRHYENVTVSTDGAHAAFRVRETCNALSGDMSTPVVVPSFAYRWAEHFALKRKQGTEATLEDMLTPLLGAQALATYMHHGARWLKTASFPGAVDGIFRHLVAVSYGGANVALLDDWRRGTRSANVTAHSLLLPQVRVPDGFPNAGRTDVPPMSLEISMRLWNFADRWSVLHPKEWVRWLAADSVALADVQAFAAQLGRAEAQYTTNQTLAASHYDQIRRWVRSLILGDAPLTDRPADADNALAVQYNADLARALREAGLIAANASMELLLAAQIGSNTVVGWAYHLVQNRSIARPDPLDALTGQSMRNVCPQSSAVDATGASIADNDELTASFEVPDVLEFSCWAARFSVVTNLGASVGAADPAIQTDADSLETIILQSRIGAERTLALIEFLTTGLSIDGYSIPGSLRAHLLVTSARSIIRHPTFASSLLNTMSQSDGLLHWTRAFYEAQLDVQESSVGSTLEAQAQARMDAAAAGLESHLSSSAVGAANAVCRSQFMSVAMAPLGLSCYEVLDLAKWLEHLARRHAYFPKLVWREENGRVDPTTLQAGPMVRTTVEDLLGAHSDPVFQLAFPAMMYPGLGPPNHMDLDSWAALDESERPEIQVRTGSDVVESMGTISLFDGVGAFAMWGEETPVSGNLFMSRVRGTYSRRNGDIPPPDLRHRTFWNAEMRRPVTLNFTQAVVDARSGVTLWRYTLDASSGVPRFASDEVAQAPLCMRAMSMLPGWDGEPSGVDFLTGPPYFAGCEAGEGSYGYSRMPLLDADKHASWVDIEPASGLIARYALRHAVYLRWRSSPWYPFLRTTIAPVIRVSRAWEARPEALDAVRRDLDFITWQVLSAIPGSFLTLMVLALGVAIPLAISLVHPCEVPEGKAANALSAAEHRQRTRRKQMRRLRRQDRAKSAALALVSSGFAFESTVVRNVSRAINVLDGRDVAGLDTHSIVNDPAVAEARERLEIERRDEARRQEQVRQAGGACGPESITRQQRRQQGGGRGVLEAPASLISRMSRRLITHADSSAEANRGTGQSSWVPSFFSTLRRSSKVAPAAAAADVSSAPPATTTQPQPTAARASGDADSGTGPMSAGLAGAGESHAASAATDRPLMHHSPPSPLPRGSASL